jgi:glycerol-3-phosphate acyltransferase PlsY
MKHNVTECIYDDLKGTVTYLLYYYYYHYYLISVIIATIIIIIIHIYSTYIILPVCPY